MSTTPPLTPYDVLGLDKTATAAQLKAAYRRLARECHPDQHPGDRAKAAQFRQVTWAYEVLSDPAKRAACDRGDAVPGPSDPESAPPEVSPQAMPLAVELDRAEQIGQVAVGTIAHFALESRAGDKVQQVARKVGITDVRGTLSKAGGLLARWAALVTQPPTPPPPPPTAPAVRPKKP